MRSFGRREALITTRALNALGAGTLLGSWWVLSATGSAARARYLPAPPEVFAALARGVADGDILVAFGETLHHFAIAYASAVVGGLTLGVLLGRFDLASRGLHPIISFLRTLPGVAVLPLMLLIFGFQPRAVGASAGFAAIWFVLLNTMRGVRSTHPTVVETAKVFRVSGPRMWLKVLLPSAAPQIATGLRTAMGIALVVAVSSEIVMGRGGLGAFIRRSQDTLQPASAYAGILLVGLFGVVLFQLAQLAEEKLIPWKGRG